MVALSGGGFHAFGGRGFGAQGFHAFGGSARGFAVGPRGGLFFFFLSMPTDIMGGTTPSITAVISIMAIAFLYPA